MPIPGDASAHEVRLVELVSGLSGARPRESLHSQGTRKITWWRDLDHLHPPCSATITTNCFPTTPPFDGNLLQIMPWPKFQSMTVHDLRAIYKYLSTIPCIEGLPAPSILHNDCT